MKHIIIFILLYYLIIGCQEKESPIATVRITDIQYLTHNSAIINGSVTNIRNGTGIGEQGVCWGRTPGPTKENDHASVVFGVDFSVAISGLKSGTQYYIRAYAASQYETAYSDEQSITTAFIDSITDARDGQVYQVKQYGNQVWMVENINYRTAESWYYMNDSSTYAEDFGRLYSFESALDVCPSGWHLPSDGEWKELELFLGISPDSIDMFLRGQNAWCAMKEPGDRLWETFYWCAEATNSSGFTVKPSGTLNQNTMEFSNLNSNAAFWTSTVDEGDVYYRFFQSHIDKIERNKGGSGGAKSVRCIKD